MDILIFNLFSWCYGKMWRKMQEDSILCNRTTFYAFFLFILNSAMKPVFRMLFDPDSWVLLTYWIPYHVVNSICEDPPFWGVESSLKLHGLMLSAALFGQNYEIWVLVVVGPWLMGFGVMLNPLNMLRVLVCENPSSVGVGSSC